MANRMASAIANRMAKVVANGWQNDAPNPNPNPNSAGSSDLSNPLINQIQIVTAVYARASDGLGLGVER